MTPSTPPHSPRPAGPRPSSFVDARDGRPTLITGGCGFVGTNLADRLLAAGGDVIVFDNLSRPGVERNLDFLRREHGERLRFIEADVRDASAVRDAVARAGRVFHFAAQVAVTTSLENVIDDFEINARGTLNVLEAIRACPEPPPLVFTSTNKVYGGLPDLPLRLTGTRYEPEDAATRARGVGETRPLDFHSPYGCSKGCADQYVLDYARTFGLPACVLRMSCVYGPHQCGNEDQGWIAHFLMKALRGEPITLYGDGFQVRDVLFVDDLIDAFVLAQDKMATTRGHAFNTGGGPANTVSLHDVLELVGRVHGTRADVRYGDWRPGDQRYYVSDTAALAAATGWAAKVGVEQGIRRLYAWLRDQDSAAATPRRPGSTRGGRSALQTAKESA